MQPYGCIATAVAKVGFKAEGWQIYAYVDNLTDERAIIRDWAGGTTGSGPEQFAAVLGPRVFNNWGVNERLIDNSATLDHCFM
jgi:hypothetical protein